MKKYIKEPLADEAERLALLWHLFRAIGIVFVLLSNKRLESTPFIRTFLLETDFLN